MDRVVQVAPAVREARHPIDRKRKKDESRVSEVQNNKVIGILALQGDYDAHRKVLEDQLGAQTRLVRAPQDLTDVDALILPGGESTTIGKLMQRIGLDDAIKARLAAGMPAYGTCAGMILLAKNIQDRPDQPTLKALNITVARNAFGRQIDSFEADVPFHPAGNNGNAEEQGNGDNAVRGVFIRAPYVVEAAPGVQVLGHFRDKIVAVQQGTLLATAFHPELTDDPQVHAYFLKIVAASKERGK